jgi:signal peptidase II
LVGVAVYWRRARPAEWPVVISLALIFGGSLGNLIDRVGVGKVTDFFYFSFIDFPVFNVADIAIVGGAGLLMAWLLFGPVPVKPSTAIDDVPDAEEVDSP